MVAFERSLDIALSTEVVEPSSQEVIVVPVTATESLVAGHGLAKHIDIMYRGVAKRASEDRALLQVFNFLSDDVTKFRRHSYDMAAILNPDGPELDPSRTSAAMALAALVRGRKSHQTGVWLKGKAADNQSASIFAELMDINRLDFFELRQQGYRQSVNNTIYWQSQLEGLRSNKYIIRLRQAIDESDHYPIEV